MITILLARPPSNEPEVLSALGRRLAAESAPRGANSNVSHTKGLVCAAFCERQIGVDIEYLRPLKLPRFGRFFAPEEIAYINERGTTEAFFYIWTRKEAFLKARRTGWTAESARFNCAAGAVEDGGTLWRLQSWTPAEGYAGAFCVRVAEPR